MAGSILLKKAHRGGWIKNQPLWARDALRRLALGEFDKNDREEILINLKTHNKISIDKKTICKDFTEDHFKTEPPDATPRTLLCSIGPSKHVNRLADDQIMKFALDGLTLIYGHNGSGKSGYCRIIKKLCRTRVKEDLLGNVYQAEEKLKAEVQVKYKFESTPQVKEKTWIDETTPPEEISRLTVFDDKCAQLYVDENNKIEYLPAEVGLLENYVNLLGDLQGLLESETKELKDRVSIPLPSGFHEGTSPSKLIEYLKESTPSHQIPQESDFREVAVWKGAKDDKKSQDLQKQLDENPIAKLNGLKTIHTRLTNIFDKIKAVEFALFSAKIDEIQKAFESVKTTAQAAKIAASKDFKDEKLSDIGSDAWRQMYQYATDYAKVIEPKNNKIPSEIDALCVLCQQPLDKAASDRLKRFETFVENKASQAAMNAARVLQNHKDAINAIRVPQKSEYEETLLKYASLSDKRKIIATNIGVFFAQGLTLLTFVKECFDARAFERPVIVFEPISQALNDDMNALEKQIKTLEQEPDGSQHYVNLQKEWDELQDRKKLNAEIAIFIQRLNDLQILARLKKCIVALDTTKASKEITKLSKNLLTQEFKENMRAEAKELNLEHIRLVPKINTEQGKSQIDFNLDTANIAPKKKVLSEGEQKAFALACFLAELRREPVKHGIIFDDPASSFDHIRTEQIAKRLVAEAKDRQVIIFTHDILFYNEVIKYVAEHRIPCCQHYIHKTEEKGFGVICDTGKPWYATSVEDRIKILKNKVNIITNKDYNDEESRRPEINDFYSDLREIWERLVEQILFNKVITRYGSDVKTQSLAGVVVEDEDYRIIYWAMAKASKYSGHDKAFGDALPLPSKEAIKEDLENIERFKKMINDRRKAREKIRKALHNPPTAQIA